MTVSGAAYALPTWEPATDAFESLSLLLTPVAAEGLKPSNTMGVARRQTTGQAFLTNQIVTLCGLDPSEATTAKPAALTADSFALLKTPTSQLAVNGGSQHPDKRKAGGHGPTLADEVEHLLPTPQAHDAQKGKTADQVAAMRARGHGVSNLNELAENELVKLLPTPAACVANDGESTATWLARRERVKATGVNGNGMGMPLTIASLLIGANTSPQSADGKLDSDGQLRGQLNLLAAITATD